MPIGSYCNRDQYQSVAILTIIGAYRVVTLTIIGAYRVVTLTIIGAYRVVTLEIVGAHCRYFNSNQCLRLLL